MQTIVYLVVIPTVIILVATSVLMVAAQTLIPMLGAAL